MTTKARDDAANGARGRGSSAGLPGRRLARRKVQRVLEERDRLMLRGISLEDVLFPRCVPAAERELRGFQSGRRVLRRGGCLECGWR